MTLSSHNSSTDPNDPYRYEGLLPPRGARQPPPLPAEDAPQPVDQIAIRKLGGFNFIDIDQWSSMPRDERMKLIKNGSVIFVYEGKEVPLKPALRYIQAVTEQTRPAELPALPPSTDDRYNPGPAT